MDHPFDTQHDILLIPTPQINTHKPINLDNTSSTGQFLNIDLLFLMFLLLLHIQFLLHLFQSLQRKLILLGEVVHVEAGTIPDAPGEPQDQQESIQRLEVNHWQRKEVSQDKPQCVESHEGEFCVAFAINVNKLARPGF